MELISSGQVVVIDVREKNEIIASSKSLKGSIQIQINEFVKKIRELVPDRNQAILVYCSSGSRSIFACHILADLGYKKVYNLQGGLE